MRLDSYSEGFAKYAFGRFPNWEKHATWVKWSSKDEYYLQIELKNSDRANDSIEMITVDEEITIQYAFYHVHEKDYVEAVGFVQGIMDEENIVVMIEDENGMRGGQWKADQPLPDENAVKSMLVRSWNGTYDKVVGSERNE